MAGDPVSDPLADGVRELLSTRPRSAGEVIADLIARDLLDADDYDPTDADHVQGFLDDVIVDDSVWATPGREIALTSQLTDGLVLTHRLTAEEVEAGEVTVFPDLGVIDWNARDGLDLATGGRLVASSVGWLTDQPSRFAGPAGWLDGCAADDLVAFTRAGETVTVERVEPGDLAPDDREVALLRAAADERIPPNRGEEAEPVVLDALVADVGAFRRPVRPASELLVAAGLEARGHEFGRVGESWRSHADVAREIRRAEAERSWDLRSCCRVALTSVLDAFDATKQAATAQAPAIDPEKVAEALGHDMVAPAFLDVVLGRWAAGRDLDALERMAAALLDEPLDGTPRASALLVAATRAGRDGAAVEAVDMLRAAMRADPEYRPVHFDLGGYEIDCSDLDSAVKLLVPPGAKDDAFATLVDLHDEVDGPFLRAGRNDRCPCGSGRKYKACCLGDRKVPLVARVPVLSYKLARFVRALGLESGLTILIVAAIGNLGDEADDATADMLDDEPVLVDFAAFEGGIGRRYLDERGPLLPPDERDLLERMLDEPRRLWDVASVEPGTGLSLVDPATGDRVTVHDRHRWVRSATDDEAILARVAVIGDEARFLGAPIVIPSLARAMTSEVVASTPDARALAGWFGAFLRLMMADDAVPAGDEVKTDR